MERNVCPYLGLPEDQNTTLHSPALGNFCHRASPAGPVRIDHQTSHCLTRMHFACPVFQAQKNAPLPAEVAAPHTRRQRTHQKLNNLIIPALLLMIILGGIFFSQTRLLSNMATLGSSSVPAQQPNLMQGFLWNGPAASPNTPASTPESTPVDETNCLPPLGWETYTIRPADTLFRISILHGVSLETLQMANCLGSQTLLTAGSVLFVPAPDPTAVPSATATIPIATATPIPNPIHAEPPGESGQDEDAPAVVSPTDPRPPEGNGSDDPPKEKKIKKKDQSQDKDKGKDKDQGKGKNKDNGKGKGKGKDK